MVTMGGGGVTMGGGGGNHWRGEGNHWRGGGGMCIYLVLVSRNIWLNNYLPTPPKGGGALHKKAYRASRHIVCGRLHELVDILIWTLNISSFPCR